MAHTAVARSAAVIAIFGVSIYLVVDVVLQVLPPHYSPISQAESDLAVGPFGSIMAVNFFGRGVTSAAAIVAIAQSVPRSVSRNIGLTFFAIAGFCSALIAFFATDIASEGTRASHPTSHGTIHLLGASTGFVCALAAFWLLTPVLGRAIGSNRATRDGRPRLVAIFLVVATAGLLALAITIVWVPALFGLAERVCLLGILGWVFAAMLMLRPKTARD
jgi:hypothetical protein